MYFHILLFVLIFALTGCLHKVETTSPASDTSVLKHHKTIVIAPFSNDYYDFQNILYTSFKDNKNYDLIKQDSKGNKKKEDKVEKNALRIEGSLSLPKIERRQYFKDQTICYEEHCWRQKVLCIERNTSLEISIFIYSNRTSNIIHKTILQQQDLRTHCADAQVPISSTNKIFNELAKKMATTFIQDVTSNIKQK